MAKRRFVLIFFIFLFFLPLSGCDSPKATVFLGDSLTHGTPYGPEFSWVAHVDLPQGEEKIIKAVPGETSGQMLDRFKEDVLSQKPGRLVIMAGTIDADVGVPLENYQDNLRSMTKMAREKKIEVFLVTPLPSAYPEFNPILKQFRAYVMQFAREENIPVIDFYTLMEDSKTGLLKEDLNGDGIHPTKEGYRLMGWEATKLLNK